MYLSVVVGQSNKTLLFRLLFAFYFFGSTVPVSGSVNAGSQPQLVPPVAVPCQSYMKGSDSSYLSGVMEWTFRVGWVVMLVFLLLSSWES